MKKYHFFIMITMILMSLSSGNAQTNVNSLAQLRAAVQNSNQSIVMASGNYDLEDLSSSSRNIIFSGSNNTIDLTGVYIRVPVGSVDESYLLVEGNNITITGGEVEDVYRNGLTEITDFSAYNQDRTNLAHGLGGDAVMNIDGDDNLINGLKLTVRGSYPYGYGSMYGIGSNNVYGLDKRCGILVRGQRNTIDNVELQQRAFGHGIYMQGDADETVIKNTLVEGRVRPTGDLYQETNSYDLPYRSNYQMPLDDNAPIPTDEVHSLCEDGFRMYNIPGSVTVENCVAKKMRGGVRLYLGGPATVTNTTSIDCGATNWNMPSGGEITNSSGNFAYATLSDFRLNRSNMDIEWTIIPSPHATGPHNLCDVLGSNHNIVFHRTPGPLDSDEERAIVISGDNSTIVNETEYRIILESSASGNTIITCGSVTDYGSGNTITQSSNCDFDNIPIECSDFNAFTQIEAEDYCNESGTQITSSGNVGYIENGEWIMFEDVDFENGAASITASVSSGSSGGNIEIRQGSTTGNLLGTLEVSNTGSWTTWETISTNIGSVSGVQDIYLVFTGGSGYLLDVDSFQFSPSIVDCDLPWLEGTLSVTQDTLNYTSGSIDISCASSVNISMTVEGIGPMETADYLNVYYKVDGGSQQTLLENTNTISSQNISMSNISGDSLELIINAFTSYADETYTISNIQVSTSNITNYDRIEAEDYDAMNGIQTEVTTDDGGGENVGWINNGNWLRFDDINISGLSNMDARIACNYTGGIIEVRTGSTTGTLIGSISVSNTGGNQNWQTLNTSISNASGIQDIYLVFTGGSGYLFNLNWIEFNNSSQSNKDIATTEIDDISIYPNPVSAVATIQNAANSSITIYDIKGSEVFTQHISN
ncbi:carbohydrate-binding protein, partial [Aquimarina pacifica]|uniref:carbohydrate-binding protein n=1 Tax=Aquimarina pacifica TaxID=1296415 RepID=UPI001267FEB4